MKQKTHKGTAKRIKVTGSGKLRREQAGRRHLLEGKPSKRCLLYTSPSPRDRG